MLLKLNGKVFKVKWFHDHEYYEYDKKRNGITTCTIENLEKTARFTGIAQCSKKDQYRKEEGRVISTERAAEALAEYFCFFNPEVKEQIVKEILAQYRNR